MKKDDEPHAFSFVTKKLAVTGIQKAKLKFEKEIKKIRATDNSSENHRYCRKLILRKENSPWISPSEVYDSEGNLKYRIFANLIKKKRTIQIQNTQSNTIASASENKSAFDIWGFKRNTYFVISITDSACGKARPGAKGFHSTIQIEPQNWNAVETRHKCEVIGPNKNVLAETNGLIRKQEKTTISFYSEEDEILLLLIFLLHTSLSYRAFSEEYDKYCEKMWLKSSAE